MLLRVGPPLLVSKAPQTACSHAGSSQASDSKQKVIACFGGLPPAPKVFSHRNWNRKKSSTYLCLLYPMGHRVFGLYCITTNDFCAPPAILFFRRIFGRSSLFEAGVHRKHCCLSCNKSGGRARKERQITPLLLPHSHGWFLRRPSLPADNFFRSAYHHIHGNNIEQTAVWTGVDM